jgi:hypothetical protein
MRCKFFLLWLALALSSLPAGAVTLRYSFKKSAEMTYQIQAACLSRSSSSDADKVASSTVLLQRYRFRVIDVSPQGDATIEQEVLLQKVTVDTEGRTMSHTLAVNGEKATMTLVDFDGKENKKDIAKPKPLRFLVSPAGSFKVLRTAAPAEIDEPANQDEKRYETARLAGLTPLGGIGLEMNLLSSCILVPLPSKDVDINESWENTLTMKDNASMGAQSPDTEKVLVKSQLLGIVDYQDRKCAKISTTYERALTGDMSDPVSEGADAKISTTGKLTGSMTWYLDQESAYTAGAAGTMQMLMKMKIELPAEVAAEVPPEMLNQESTVALKANIKTTLMK